MIRRAVFWAFTGQFATFIVSFAGSIAVARLLSPRELGVYAVAIATLGILQIATSFGTASYIVKEAELSEQTLRTAFSVNAALSVALAFLLVAASHPAAHFLDEPSVAPVLQVLAITPLLAILEFRPSAMLQREMQFKLISLVSALRAAAGALATVAAALLGASYLSPAYGALASAAVGLVGFMIAGRRYNSVRMSMHGWRAITLFGVQMMSVGGVAGVSARLSDIVMGRLLGIEILGLFARANNLSGLLFSNIYGTATRIIFAKLAKDFRERGVVHETFMPSLRMISALMGPISLGIAVLSEPIVLLLYGEKWSAAAPVLSILMVAQYVSLGFAMNWELFVIRGELGLQSKFEVARSGFGLVAQTIGCFFGMLGAAFACVVGALFSMALYAPHMKRLADAKPREFAGIYGETTFLSFVAAAPSLALMFAFGWSSHVPLYLVFGTIVAGVALWLVALFRLGHPLATELRHWTAAARARFFTQRVPIGARIEPLEDDR